MNPSQAMKVHGSNPSFCPSLERLSEFTMFPGGFLWYIAAARGGGGSFKKYETHRMWIMDDKAKTLMDRTVQLCDWLTAELSNWLTDSLTG